MAYEHMVRKPPDTLAHQRSLLAINEVAIKKGLPALPGKRWGMFPKKALRGRPE